MSVTTILALGASAAVAFLVWSIAKRWIRRALILFMITTVAGGGTFLGIGPQLGDNPGTQRPSFHQQLDRLIDRIPE
jgi:hypothetical protein